MPESRCIPAELLFMGTVGGARALDMEDRIGNLDAGREADFLVIDPAGWSPLSGAIDRGPAPSDPDLATRPDPVRAADVHARTGDLAGVRPGTPDRQSLTPAWSMTLVGRHHV